MVLVDTSLWVDHLRLADPTLDFLLQQRQVLGHPFVVGEVAMGRMRHRHRLLQMMDELPRALVRSDGEVRRFIEKHPLCLGRRSHRRAPAGRGSLTTRRFALDAGQAVPEGGGGYVDGVPLDTVA